MTLNQYIEKLQALAKEHGGDLPVVAYDSYEGYFLIADPRIDNVSYLPSETDIIVSKVVATGNMK